MFYYRHHPNPLINAAIGFAKALQPDNSDALIVEIFTKFKLYPHDLNNKKPTRPIIIEWVL